MAISQSADAARTLRAADPHEYEEEHLHTLPNFLIIGAAKCGTTSLYMYCAAHPQISMSTPKEVDFFNRHWELGTEWYASHFEHNDVVGEASTGYTAYPDWPETPERIAATVPAAKLVYLVRHPIEQMKSNYAWQAWIRGVEHRPIEVALAEDAYYLDLVRYSTQLNRYLPFFEREQILVTKTERLRSRRVETLERVFDFLEVVPMVRPEMHRDHNVTRRKRGLGRFPLLRRLQRFPSTEIPPGLERELIRELEPEIRGLDRFIPDFGGWGLACSGVLGLLSML